MAEPTLAEVFPAWKEQTQQSKLILNDTTEQPTELGVLTEQSTELGVLTELGEPVELTESTEVGEIGDNEAQGVIQAIEPILKTCCKRKVKSIKAKSVNLFRGQPIITKFRNARQNQSNQYEVNMFCLYIYKKQ